MLQYLSIPGPRDAPKGLPGIAFDKLDGQNVRFEWTKKRGWYKFGTRRRLFDENEPGYGPSIALFLNKYGDAIPKVMTDNKDYRGVTECTVFGEFCGPNSFAGMHDPNDVMDVVFFDISVYKKGFVSPRTFLKHFGHLHIPTVVYEGNFNQPFINDVREGKYPVKEGIVIKGNKSSGKPPHNLWMAKVKTKAWLQKLREHCSGNPDMAKFLEENEREQSWE